MTALNEWFANHPDHSDDAILAAVYARMTDNLWLTQANRLPWRASLPKTCGLLVERLRKITWLITDADNTDEHQQDRSTISRICLKFPTDPGLSALIATWRDTRWKAELCAVRDSLAGNDAVLDQMIRTALRANQLSLPDSFNYWMQSAGELSMNLGLWSHRPTAERLAALRETLHGPLISLSTMMIVAMTGGSYWPVCGDSEETDRLVKRPGAFAIPAALTLDALNDQRLIPAPQTMALTKLGNWGRNSSPNIQNVHDLRVCDWAAAHLLANLRNWSYEAPPGLPDADALLSKPSAERDRIIAMLREDFAVVVKEQLIHARLAQPDPSPANKF